MKKLLLLYYTMLLTATSMTVSAQGNPVSRTTELNKPVVLLTGFPCALTVIDVAVSSIV